MGSMKPDVKRRVQRRLEIIAGQVRGLIKMVDEDAYCIDVITQTSAVRKALSSIEDLMLEHHLQTHVAEQMRRGESAKATREVLSVYKRSKNK